MATDIRIYAKGNAFASETYDLRTLETIISNYRIILDRLVAVQLGRRQITEQVKQQIGYETKIRNGSLELLITFVFQHKELLGAIVADDGGTTLAHAITRLYMGALDLKKAVAKLIEKDITFTININNSFNFANKNNNTTVHINGKNIEISDPRVLWAAQAIRGPSDKIIGSLDGQELESVEFGTIEQSYKVDSNDRNIVGHAKEELNATIEIQGRLDMVAFTSHRGIVVSDNERFPVRWDESIRRKMQKIADVSGVSFKVRPIIDKKQLGSDAIAFHVIDCSNPSGKKLL